MLSLAGLPPMGGFIAKITIWSSAVDTGQTYLAVVGVAATLVGLGYYLKIPLRAGRPRCAGCRSRHIVRRSP